MHKDHVDYTYNLQGDTEKFLGQVLFITTWNIYASNIEYAMIIFVYL